MASSSKSLNEFWNGRGRERDRPIRRGHRHSSLKHNKSEPGREFHSLCIPRGLTHIEETSGPLRPYVGPHALLPPSSSSSTSSSSVTLPLRHRSSCFIQQAERERRRRCQLASVSVGGRHARRPDVRAATPHARRFATKVAPYPPTRLLHHPTLRKLMS